MLHGIWGIQTDSIDQDNRSNPLVHSWDGKSRKKDAPVRGVTGYLEKGIGGNKMYGSVPQLTTESIVCWT
jgi:hypothetical protein